MMQVEVSEEMAAALNTLHAQLTKDYGADFSYIVCAKGKAIDASTRNGGRVEQSKMHMVTARNGYEIND